ncbi:HAMP domain-containing histidine kinase [bacterium]|nr:HAMP domain-containing histidine kinase [bacterium]
MSFVFNFSNKETDFIKDAFTYISRYSQGEIIITDEKFNILFRNVSNGIGQNFLDLDKNFVTPDFKNNINDFKKSEKNHLFVKLIFNHDGNFSNLPVDVHICKIRNKKGEIKGFAIIIQDITNEIKNKIQRETFVDILSHDLRNPLRANVQILEMILNNKFGRIENNLKVMLNELLDSCRFMNYMAENLVVKYKNEFNMYELLKEPYSIIKLIKDRYNALSNMLNKKHQNIELIVNGTIEDVNIDVDAIEKVINSLIISASEENSEKSVIKIKVENIKEFVEITFFNCGSKRKDLPDIFEEYLTCSNRFRKVGFSLELYNCKRIIEAHNGNIIAKNTGNSGMKIKIRLPLYR